MPSVFKHIFSLHPHYFKKIRVHPCYLASMVGIKYAYVFKVFGCFNQRIRDGCFLFQFYHIRLQRVNLMARLLDGGENLFSCVNKDHNASVYFTTKDKDCSNETKGFLVFIKYSEYLLQRLIHDCLFVIINFTFLSI